MTQTVTTNQDRFGQFGGKYVPETLIPALEELEVAYETAMLDPEFRRELDELLREYVGRPSALTFAPRLSERVGAQVWMKREDLNHTGALVVTEWLTERLAPLLAPAESAAAPMRSDGGPGQQLPRAIALPASAPPPAPTIVPSPLS